MGNEHKRNKADYQDERRRKTASSAIALIEDLAYFRRLLKQSVLSGSDVRRATAQLRRILVDGDLTKISSPRTGKIEILVPDHVPFLQTNKAANYLFFALGHVSLLGVDIAAIGAASGDPNDPSVQPVGFNPDKRVAVSLERFMSQPAIVIDGLWFSRREIIKFIANMASGVHSGEKFDERDERLMRRRYAISFVGDQTLTVKIVQQGLSEDAPDTVVQEGIDGILFEVLATTGHLTNSPDVNKLEDFVRDEFRL